ncbi:MAG: sigma-70 family RNA polymerase sigma factor [Oscillatoriales cyanobacterium RM2_1_1]|nr:sigma-70 family RNA polymerase sigma factor [Oscillatoriales cyanobacterium SM2_3_0]NJO46100.1 sigma-70 family RNA polymerase sigma factor [Oscillatoriales cyanobacterium RM2_1_1]
MASISTNTSDAQLVQQLRAGHPQALSILYDRYSGLVYSLALKVLNQSSEAEDLTQDIFLNFWKQEQFDPERAALSTYLCVMTRSRALNKLKSSNSRQRTLERLQTNTPEEFSSLTPLEQASQAEQEQTVRAALSQLSDRQRQILEMNFYHGISHAEISRQLEVPLGTVKTNARQGLLKLRKLLGGAIA